MTRLISSKYTRGLLVATAALLAAGCQLPGPGPARGPELRGNPLAGSATAVAPTPGATQGLPAQPGMQAGQVPATGVALASHVAPAAAMLPGRGPLGGYTCPPNGCPPQAHAGQGHAGPCTAGCCGTAAPCYPTMPPMSFFGIDSQEYLCDGGDDDPRAMYTRNDAIVGVNLEDSVVKYETARGDIHVTPSNRVCVYAPRFASVRRVSGAVTAELPTGPRATELAAGPVDVLSEQPSGAVMTPLGPEHNAIAKGPDGMRAREAGIPVDVVQSPILAEDVLAALVNLSVIDSGVLREADKPFLAKGALAAEIWSEGLAPEVAIDLTRVEVASRDVAARGLTTYELPGGRLRVIKVADRQAAPVGDVITFVFRIDNIGEGPIDSVVLTDNLTTRLEYIADSQSCTKGVEFETSDNDGGSLRLTWKFTDDFKVGEGAIIRFRCRVR